MDFIKTQLDDISVKMGVSIFLGEEKELVTPTPENKPVTAFPSFKLPIQYQPVDSIYPLSSLVVDDLELATSTSQTPLYEFLFQPSHDFSKKMIQEWKTTISLDPLFLKETQTVVENMGVFESDAVAVAPSSDPNNTLSNDASTTDLNKEASISPIDTKRLTNIWNDLTNDPYFLEKYSYIEFDFLNYLNHSSSFLQFVTYANILSPLASILFPVIVLILPFLILNFTNNEVNLSSYMDVLKDLAKNHFIGKTITNMQKIDVNKMAYIIGSFFMYLIQIYNNVVTCCHFYRNILKINEDLIYLREFIQRSHENMEVFANLHASKPTYAVFCKDLMKYSNILKFVHCELSPITPFTVSFSKLSGVGYMLKCYYLLYSTKEYMDAIQFSFGFEGYIDNMKGVHTNWKKGNISTATFAGKSPGLTLTNQYYPSYDTKTAVKNTVKLGGGEATYSLPKGIIITGPNASGKTTLLKTTALNIIFSQQIGMGYYSVCHMKPYKYIHSYLNIPDTSGRDSLFQAEARRCKEIIDSIHSSKEGDNHFCMFDELYSGTNPVEASKASYAFLNYLTEFKNVHFMLTTHYNCVCKKIIKKRLTNIKNYKMDVKENVQVGGGKELEYTYKMVKGISNVEGAINVLKTLDYPQKIIEFFENGH